MILVPEHKRQADGPALISLSQQLKDMLQTFVEKIRPQFPGPKGEHVFLKNDGEPFTGGRISKRVPEFWQKTGVRPELQVTATNIRKWIVTVCHN